MRTNTIPEKVFEYNLDALKYSQVICDGLTRKVYQYHTLGYGLNNLFADVCATLELIPLYHHVELSVRDGLIRIELEISLINHYDCGPPKFWQDQHIIILSILDFLEEDKDNGVLAYNPAEGF